MADRPGPSAERAADSAPAGPVGVAEEPSLREGETFLEWGGAALGGAARWLRTPEGALAAGILTLAVLLRLWDLGSRAVHHDESLHAYYSWVLARTGRYVHNPLMHGTFQFLGMGLVFKVFGFSDSAARLLAAFSGTAVVAMPFLLLRRQLGRWGVVVTALLLAVSPGLLYFSRFAREDIYLLLWTFLLAACLWRYLEDPAPRWLYAAAAALALAFTTKEAAYILALVFGLFLLLHGLPDLPALVRSRFRAWTPGPSLLLVLVTLVLPLGAAGIGLFQGWLGLHLVNPDPGTPRSEGALAYLPAPIGVPVSQGPGLASALFDRLRDLTGLALVSPRALESPAAGSLRVAGVTLQALDVATFVTVGLFLMGALLGLLWNWRRWLMTAAIFWSLFAFLFTSFFTNWLGLGSGVWQSLGYWIAQQDVARGGQPWYYYPMLLATYEFLPLAAGLASGAYFLKRRDPFGTFLALWFLLALAMLTYAGEKMPWLSIHLTLPLVLLAGRGLGLLAETTWRRRNALAPPQSLLRWGGLGAAAALLLVTAGSSLRASFANGDLPVELLVYTQTSPAIARTAREIDRLAQATGQGRDLPVTVDTMDGFAWPWYWYLRDYRRVEYRCLGDPGSCAADAQPLSRGPAQGQVLVLNAGNEAAAAPYLEGYEPGVLIPFRQWFPEESYRGPDYAAGLSPWAVLRGAFDPSTWGTLWRYWAFREPPRPLGHIDVVVYVRKGLAARPLTRPPGTG